ncbi:MAG TPA: hypothetical protein VGW33_15735 [Terriglobia bacterium]|nr:hypothetical protein [Terriglobia bacterium]
MAEDRNIGNRMFGLNEPRRTQPEAVPPGPAGTEGAETPRAAGSGPAAGQPTGQAPAPQYVYVQGAPPATAGGTSKVLIALVAALVVLAGVNLYLGITTRQQFTELAAKQSDQLNVLAHRMDSSDERYAQLRGQFQVTTEKLGLTQQELGRARQLAANIEKQQQAAVSQLNQQIAQKASAEELSKAQADANAKFGTVDGNISDINKKIGDTNSALSGAKGELSGAIARTHDELVALAHRTDRDYFEFNLAARGSKQKIGGVTLELAKTNTKKNLYTLNLYFDDKRTVRKDQAIDSPVQFYVEGAPSALELVVNKIGRRNVSGYLSAPKGFVSGAPNVLGARPGA